MREIKFRGKRIDNGEWVYGYAVEGFGRWFIGIEFGINTTRMGTLLCCTPKYFEVIPETVGLYIGLEDRNGKEIYEFDLVMVLECHKSFKAKPFTVGFQDGAFVLELKEGKISFITYGDQCRTEGIIEDSFSQNLEVIGNIHSNPELLQ